MHRRLISNHFKSLRSLRRGNVIVLAAAMMVMIFGFTSFTVDVGYITLTKAQLQTANDSAVLSAVMEIPDGLGLGPTKSQDQVEAAAIQAAVDVAARHQAGDRDSVHVDSSRDVRLGQVAWNADTNSWVKSWGVTPYNLVEVTLHRDQAPGDPDGALPLFFGPVIGHQHARLSTTATAAILPGNGFRIKPGSGQTISILPIALDEPTWENLVQHGITELNPADKYRWDEASKSITIGADGIKELSLYPSGSSSMPPGNRGTVDLGHANNSTSDLSRQIRYGLSQSDLDALGFPLTFENGPLYINGDTGISAGIKDDLESIKGKPRAIPIFREVHGPGNNATYTIVKFVGIRIMHVKLTGNPKYVIIQPAPFSDSTVTRDESATIEDAYIFTSPVLIR